MRLKDILFLTTVLLTVWNAALIWMTQVVCYPLWPLVGTGQFHAYHLAWWHRVWLLFIPAGLAFFGSVALLFRRPQYISLRFVLMAVCLQVLTYTLTAFYWAPLQAGLSTAAGLSMRGFEELLWTHWFRVALVWLTAGVLIVPLGRRVTADA